jgi:hypothetical protein
MLMPASPAIWATRQVVGCSREGEGPTDAIAYPELGLLLAADRLHPAEGFLDPFADALADGVSGVSRGSAVDRRHKICLRYAGR